MNKQKILHSPFDVETHKQNFINYCEVIIWPDGKIEYAVPSHNEALIKAYAKQHGLSRDEAVEEARLRFGFYAIDSIMKETGIIEVWYDYLHNETPLTENQRSSLSMLLENDCISDACFNSYKVL